MARARVVEAIAGPHSDPLNVPCPVCAFTQGSYNAVFWVVGRGDLLTRQPLHNIDSDLLAAVYNQGPALLRHLRAACAIHRDSKQPIGVRVMGLLPVVNRRVPDLTTGEALRSLCAAKGKVAIAMVLERLTTVEEVAKALAAYTVARGPWQVIGRVARASFMPGASKRLARSLRTGQLVQRLRSIAIHRWQTV